MFIMPSMISYAKPRTIKTSLLIILPIPRKNLKANKSLKSLRIIQNMKTNVHK